MFSRFIAKVFIYVLGMYRQNLGKWGERQAIKFLQKMHFQIKHLNYHKRCGEVDIIAYRNQVWHFIEVKTRTVSSVAVYGNPEEAVTPVKQKKIIAAAYAYLQDQVQNTEVNWQIDVITVICDPSTQKKRLRYIPYAFSE